MTALTPTCDEDIIEAIRLARSERASIAVEGQGTKRLMGRPMQAKRVVSTRAMTGITLLHIPYKGGGPALIDTVGGQVQMMIVPVVSAIGHIKSNRLRALGVSGARRSPMLPDVPTIAESGYPGFSATNWYAFIATSKMSPALQERWNAELVKVLKSPDVVAALNKHGLPAQPGTREELAQIGRAHV